MRFEIGKERLALALVGPAARRLFQMLELRPRGHQQLREVEETPRFILKSRHVSSFPRERKSARLQARANAHGCAKTQCGFSFQLRLGDASTPEIIPGAPGPRGPGDQRAVRPMTLRIGFSFSVQVRAK
jgi:hypothetical protein